MKHTDDKTNTALHWAAKCGRPKDITALLKAPGIEINARTVTISEFQHASQAELLLSVTKLQKVVVSLGENECPTAFCVFSPPPEPRRATPEACDAASISPSEVAPTQACEPAVSCRSPAGHGAEFRRHRRARTSRR